MLSLPHMDFSSVSALSKCFKTDELPVLMDLTRDSSEAFEKCLLPYLDGNHIHDVRNAHFCSC